MAPAFEQAAAELEPRIRLTKVDTEAVPSLGARYNIRSIPTMALLWAGARWRAKAAPWVQSTLCAGLGQFRVLRADHS
jgi:thioredoxin 2